MKEILLSLALSTLVSHIGRANEYSFDDVPNECKNIHWEHCYPENGDCMTIIHYTYSNASHLPPSDSKDVLVTGNFSTDDFTGTRCGPRHPKTGDRRCCSYKNGSLISCSNQ